MPRRPPAILPFLLAACLCDGRTLAQDKQLLTKLPGSSDTVVEFSRDGKFLLTTGDGEARVWLAETLRAATGPIRHEGLAAATFADRADVLLTAGRDVRLWEARTGRQLGQPVAVPPVDRQTDEASRRAAGWGIVTWPATPWPAAVSPDGSRVAVTRVVPRPDGPAHWNVEVWDVTPRKQVASLPHGLRPAFVRFSPDGRRLLTAEPFDQRPHGGGEAFHLWDLAAGREAWPPVRTDYNYAVPAYAPAAFSPDGTILAIGSRWSFALYDAVTGRRRPDARPHQPENVGQGTDPDLASLAFSADGRRLLARTQSTFRVWDVATCTPTSGGTGGDATLSADGGRVAAVASAGEKSYAIIVCEVAGSREIARIPLGEIWSQAVSPDGSRVAAVGDDFTGIWAIDPPK